MTIFQEKAARAAIALETPGDSFADKYYPSALEQKMSEWGFFWTGQIYSKVHHTQAFAEAKAKDKRRFALKELRNVLKKRKITHSDLALATGKSDGWIGICLRGGYPHFDANFLP